MYKHQEVISMDTDRPTVTRSIRQTSGRPYKLTAEQVDAIVVAYNDGASERDLAEQYHVSTVTIRKRLRERVVSSGN